MPPRGHKEPGAACCPAWVAGTAAPDPRPPGAPPGLRGAGAHGRGRPIPPPAGWKRVGDPERYVSGLLTDARWLELAAPPRRETADWRGRSLPHSVAQP